MNKKICFMTLGLLFVSVGFAEATANSTSSNWDNISVRPNDGWDNYAIEGQSCSDSYYSRQCAPGLACEYYAGNGGAGICRRVCSSHRDCSYDQYCDIKAYNIGVCRSNYEPTYPGRPGRPALEGERCSNDGYRYPRCDYNLFCNDGNGDGLGICMSGRPGRPVRPGRPY
jgi:hypothetical protein